MRSGPSPRPVGPVRWLCAQGPQAPEARPVTDSLIVEYALGYAARGWAVFPLKPRSKEPYPGTRGFKDASRDPDTIRRMFAGKADANIGIATGAISGIWVLDVDNKDGAGGLDSLNRLMAEHGPLPETLIALTPTGGYHYYWRYDPARPVKSRTNIAPGIDVRGDGGYVVAPPSTHPEGGQYVRRGI